MRLFAVAALAIPLFVAPSVFAAKPEASVPQAKTGLVFIANTGLEDVQTLSNSLRHATAAKASGHLDEVVWLVYGRAILSLDPSVKAVPASVRENLEQARAAGVRLVACGHALEQHGIDPATIPAGVEVVPNAMHELARLVAGGFEALRY